MTNFTEKEATVIEEFLNAVIDDVDSGISFLVNGLHFDDDEINEMGCLEINEMIENEIKNIDFQTFITASEDLDLEGFDHNSVYQVDGDKPMTSDGTVRQPCKNPCPSCPYTKDAVPGYFGGHDGNDYADAISQDTVIACHTRTKHDESTGLPKSHDDIVICTGHIVSQIKSCKSTRHTDGAQAHEMVRELENFEDLKENALAFDFKPFHNLK